MAILFAANAIWWAFRTSNTLTGAWLDSLAADRGTTVENAFEGYWRAKARGEDRATYLGIHGTTADALVWFVQFGYGRRYTKLSDFLIDTAAVGTTGLGLAAKRGLGERILATLGVRTAETSGSIIDGIIDMVGGFVSGSGSANIGDILKSVFDLAKLFEEETDPVTKAAAGLIASTAQLTGIIAPILSGGVNFGTAVRALVAIPNIFAAAVNVFGAVLGFLGVVNDALPEDSKPKVKTIVTDPQFRAAVEAAKKKVPKGVDPGFFASKSKPPVRIGKPPPIAPGFLGPVAPKGPAFGGVVERTGPTGPRPIGSQPIFIPFDPSPGDIGLLSQLREQTAATRFQGRFRTAVRAGRLADILEELKKEGRRGFPIHKAPLIPGRRRIT